MIKEFIITSVITALLPFAVITFVMLALEVNITFSMFMIAVLVSLAIGVIINIASYLGLI